MNQSTVSLKYSGSLSIFGNVDHETEGIKDKKLPELCFNQIHI